MRIYITATDEHMLQRPTSGPPRLRETLRRTRSQAVAVARIADRTASHHLWGSRGVIGHVTVWYHICHVIFVGLWNGVSISSRFRDIAL